MSQSLPRRDDASPALGDTVFESCPRLSIFRRAAYATLIAGLSRIRSRRADFAAFALVTRCSLTDGREREPNSAPLLYRALQNRSRQ